MAPSLLAYDNSNLLPEITFIIIDLPSLIIAAFRFGNFSSCGNLVVPTRQQQQKKNGEERKNPTYLSLFLSFYLDISQLFELLHEWNLKGDCKDEGRGSL